MDKCFEGMGTSGERMTQEEFEQCISFAQMFSK